MRDRNCTAMQGRVNDTDLLFQFVFPIVDREGVVVSAQAMDQCLYVWCVVCV